MTHDNAAFGALALLSGILGAAAGERVVAAVIGLAVAVIGQLLLRALTPSADALGKTLLVRVTGRWRALRLPPSDPPPPASPGSPPSSPST